MTTSSIPTSRATTVHSLDTEVHVEHRGDGPDVLLIAGLGDPIEAWQAQLDGLGDRYHLIAFDNRGVGRTPLPPTPFSVATMADDAAAVLQGLGVGTAHVAGFSAGSLIARELTRRHPELVRSLVLVGTFGRWDTLLRNAARGFQWQAEAAPSERAFLESFYTWIYTPRAHDSGLVGSIIDEALAFPHPTSPEAMRRTLDALLKFSDLDRLSDFDVPTLVLTGELDLVCPPRHGRAVAAGIPGAVFEVVPGEAHQPFQESPEAFNARVEQFWREVEARAIPPVRLSPARNHQGKEGTS